MILFGEKENLKGKFFSSVEIHLEHFHDKTKCEFSNVKAYTTQRY